MDNQEELKVEGFLFSNTEDAELARQEKRKMEYIKHHRSYNTPDNLLKIYRKAVEERIFKTPVGISYLKELRTLLIQYGISEEEIPDIPIYHEMEPKLRTVTAPARKRVASMEKDVLQNKLRFSRFINLVLLIFMIAMFAITLKGNNPNILNYEKALVNKYASWEQSLTEREEIVREKEKSLEIN